MLPCDLRASSLNPNLLCGMGGDVRSLWQQRPPASPAPHTYPPRRASTSGMTSDGARVGVGGGDASGDGTSGALAALHFTPLPQVPLQCIPFGRVAEMRGCDIPSCGHSVDSRSADRSCTPTHGQPCIFATSIAAPFGSLSGSATPHHGALSRTERARSQWPRHGEWHSGVAWRGGVRSAAGTVAVRVQDYLAKAPAKRLEPIAGSVAGSNEASGGEVPHPADSGGSGLEALERNMTDLMRSNSEGPHPEAGATARLGPSPAGLHHK